MQEWRNWQTRRLQVPVVAISCGFKSHFLHSFFIYSKAHGDMCFFVFRFASRFASRVRSYIFPWHASFSIISHALFISLLRKLVLRTQTKLRSEKLACSIIYENSLSSCSYIQSVAARISKRMSYRPENTYLLFSKTFSVYNTSSYTKGSPCI